MSIVYTKTKNTAPLIGLIQTQRSLAFGALLRPVLGKQWSEFSSTMCLASSLTPPLLQHVHSKATACIRSLLMPPPPCMPLDQSHRKQSLAAQLPPEIILPILSFVESRAPEYHVTPTRGWWRKILVFESVCQTWRAASTQLQGRSVYVHSMNHLKDLVVTLRSRAEVDESGVRRLYFYGNESGNRTEKLELLVELSDMSRRSLRYLRLNDAFCYTRGKFTAYNTKKVTKLICDLKNLEHLTLEGGFPILMNDVCRYAQISPSLMVLRLLSYWRPY